MDNGGMLTGTETIKMYKIVQLNYNKKISNTQQKRQKL